MIREERDPGFWTRIASHPAVMDGVFGITPEIVARVVQTDRVIPLASEHGGFIFCPIDGLGMVLELHSLFTPEGWGREVHRAGTLALQRVFADHSLIVTYEIAGKPASRPPKSFGFRPTGDFKPGDHETARIWLLTREAWEQSPARRRLGD